MASLRAPKATPLLGIGLLGTIGLILASIGSSSAPESPAAHPSTYRRVTHVDHIELGERGKTFSETETVLIERQP